MAQRPQPVPLRRTNGVSDPPCYSFSRIDDAAGTWKTPSSQARRVSIQETISDQPAADDIKSSPDSYIWISIIALLFSPFYGWLSVTLSLKSLTARERYNWAKAKELGRYALIISIIGLTVTVTIVTIVVNLCITRIQCWGSTKDRPMQYHRRAEGDYATSQSKYSPARSYRRQKAYEDPESYVIVALVIFFLNPLFGFIACCLSLLSNDARRSGTNEKAHLLGVLSLYVAVMGITVFVAASTTVMILVKADVIRFRLAL